MQPYVVTERHFVGVRIFAAGFGPYFIDAAIQVFAQKRAWGCVYDLIPVFIAPDILFAELCGLHPQLSGNSFDIRVVHNGRNVSAAPGTTETIHPCEYFFMQPVGKFIEFFVGKPRN
jgi:hypothetical protein